MNNLLRQLRDKGNTVLVVEHDKDVISIADHVIDAWDHGGRTKRREKLYLQGSYPSCFWPIP